MVKAYLFCLVIFFFAHCCVRSERDKDGAQEMKVFIVQFSHDNEKSSINSELHTISAFQLSQLSTYAYTKHHNYNYYLVVVPLEYGGILPVIGSTWQSQLQTMRDFLIEQLEVLEPDLIVIISENVIFPKVNKSLEDLFAVGQECNNINFPVQIWIRNSPENYDLAACLPAETETLSKDSLIYLPNTLVDLERRYEVVYKNLFHVFKSQIHAQAERYFFPQDRTELRQLVKALSKIYKVSSNFLDRDDSQMVHGLEYTIALEGLNVTNLLGVIQGLCYSYSIPHIDCEGHKEKVLEKMYDQLEFLTSYVKQSLHPPTLLPIHTPPINRSQTTTPRFLLLQVINDGYTIYSHEWNQRRYPYSLIFLSHLSIYLYALRHGYEYLKVVVPDEYISHINRHATWLKVFMFYQILQYKQEILQYDYIVLFDADIVILQPEMSLVEKMSTWAASRRDAKTKQVVDWREVDVFMPNDTDIENNFGMIYPFRSFYRNVNTGFQIWKVTEQLATIISDWINCAEVTDDVCEYFHEEWGWDQGAFNYLKYYYQEKYNLQLQIIDCDEANGFPTAIPNNMYKLFNEGNYNCSGQFLAHFWQGSKAAAVDYVTPVLIQEILDLLFAEIQNVTFSL